jgi:hypothetical protein
MLSLTALVFESVVQISLRAGLVGGGTFATMQA